MLHIFDIPIYLEHGQRVKYPIDIYEIADKIKEDFNLLDFSLSFSTNAYLGIRPEEVKVIELNVVGRAIEGVDTNALVSEIKRIFIT